MSSNFPKANGVIKGFINKQIIASSSFGNFHQSLHFPRGREKASYLLAGQLLMEFGLLLVDAAQLLLLSLQAELHLHGSTAITLHWGALSAAPKLPRTHHVPQEGSPGP